MTKLNNLEKIKAAEGMGWSAIIDDIHTVIAIDEGSGFWVKNEFPKEKCLPITVEYFLDVSEEVEITGYIYAGHLLGSGEIPEGQRFRVKSTGAIFEGENFGSYNVGVKGTSAYWNKSELEPVFD